MTKRNYKLYIAIAGSETTALAGVNAAGDGEGGLDEGSGGNASALGVDSAADNINVESARVE